MAELTRRDRLRAGEQLSELATEIDVAARWLDAIGDDADKAAVLLECAARDLRAAAWIIRPADHTRPPGWLKSSSGHEPEPSWSDLAEMADWSEAQAEECTQTVLSVHTRRVS